MDIKEEIKNLLDSNDYDVRKSGNARFMDQKVTPDVLCIISDCVVNLVESLGCENQEFTSKDIWLSEYTASNVREMFSKPSVGNSTVIREYNKFFLQPLRMLAYAGVIEENKVGTRWYFKVKNLRVLDYIAIREKNALYFIQEYLIKTLSDSGIYNIFEDFMVTQDKGSFNVLKTSYVAFIHQYTPIMKLDEPRRIFTKVLNPLSFKFNKHGTQRGYFSKDEITFNQLMYNRKNFRDINSLKNESRIEHQLRAEREIAHLNENRSKYSINKAKSLIKKRYPSSEDQRKTTTENVFEVHHIFMNSEYPVINAYTENLILLTTNQHRGEAHPRSQFQIIDPTHQYAYLTIKSHNIEYSINNEEIMYDKDDYIFVLNTGLNTTDFNVDLTYSEIRDKIEELHH